MSGALTLAILAGCQSTPPKQSGTVDKRLVGVWTSEEIPPEKDKLMDWLDYKTMQMGDLNMAQLTLSFDGTFLLEPLDSQGNWSVLGDKLTLTPKFKCRYLEKVMFGKVFPDKYGHAVELTVGKDFDSLVVTPFTRTKPKPAYRLVPGESSYQWTYKAHPFKDTDTGPLKTN